ncbi:MAG: divalent metal cation transporter [Candidatus Cybelea sp.]
MASLVVVGAATGYMLSWLVLLLLPMIAVIQTIAATIGAICPTSIQGAIRRHYGLAWALAALVAVGAVNLMTLTADLEAASESLKLLTGVPRAYFVLPFSGIVAWLLISRSYLRVERLLSFLPFIFVCYGISAVLAKPDWAALAHSLVFPRFQFTLQVATGALALLGTTLTSYVYYWESIGASQRRTSPPKLRLAKADAAWGALAPGICFLFILVATAATLGANHVRVDTATDAAAALKPLAGEWATALFAIGLLASAAIAIPVLAGTSAYVVTQTFGWRGSLDAPFGDAPRFYGIVLASLAISAAFAFVGFSPIALLYWASVAGGLATPLTLWFIIAIAQNRAIMGENRIRGWLAVAGWTVTAIVSASCVIFLVVSAFSG